MFQTFRYALGDRIEEKCPRLTVPTLIVRGAYDRIVPARWAEELAKLVPDAQVVTIVGVAHAINFSASEKLAQLTLGFLESILARLKA